MATPTDREVVEVAKHLAKLSSGQKSRVYSMSFWNERLLEWALARPKFKSQLFRFVDVFPATSSNKDVLRHVDEYLSGPEVPRPLRSAIRTAKRVPFGAAVTASQARSNVERMAKQFILGSTTKHAVESSQDLWNQGSGVILDLLGEKTVSEPEADVYAQRIEEVLDSLIAASKTWKSNTLLDADHTGVFPRACISIKPTALASKYKPLTQEAGLEQAKRRLRPLLRKACSGDAFIWFDMEHYEVKDISLRLFTELLSEDEFANADAGIVMQAYLRDTYEDLAKLIAWSGERSKPVGVRLVKGAYWDTESIAALANDWPVPVFAQKVESDVSYERCAQLLIDHWESVRPAFASHNLRSLAYAIACARKNKLPTNAYEIEMLFGMAEPMHEAVRKLGVRHRVYAPVGEVVPGMAYLVRRLLENTSNESFVRLRFAEGKALEELIKAPHVDTLNNHGSIEKRGVSDASDPDEYRPEPLVEWHLNDARDRMISAVTKGHSNNTPYVAAWIGGHERKTDRSIESIDPSTLDCVAVSAMCNTNDVDNAIESAKQAQIRWAQKSPEERAKVLFGAADWMRRRRSELTAIQIREAGKPWADADGDVCEAIDFCEYYGREALRLARGGAVQSPPGERNKLDYIPKGVGVVIAPWNFPLAIPVGMTVAALVMGNAVVLKPAEQTPWIASKLVEALHAGGLPKEVLQFLPGDGEEIGPYLVAHPKISFIAFTGSRAVGESILDQSAKIVSGQRHIKRVITELGGKNALIVDSDADLDQVVPAVLQSAFGFAGQKCSALSRLVVLDSVADALHERLINALQTSQIGSSHEMSTEIGPVIDGESQRRIADVIESAPKWGDVVASRTDLPPVGYFVPPTIVSNVKRSSPLAQNEIFGPVLATFRVADLDEAIAVANETDYALTGGLFSRSPSSIERVSKTMRAGNIYINRHITGAVVGRQPFGGYGLSGGGTKAGGPDYLLNFVESRVVTENTVRQGFAEFE